MSCHAKLFSPSLLGVCWEGVWIWRVGRVSNWPNQEKNTISNDGLTISRIGSF